MGAFIIFPVLLFSVFITAVLGFTDYVHVAMLVHAAAQNAAQAASEVPSTTASGGVLQTGPANQPIGWAQHVALSPSGINATVGPMLTGKPYITGYSCTTTDLGTSAAQPAQVYCQVHFTVDMPILGYRNFTTSASSSSLAS